MEDGQRVQGAQLPQRTYTTAGSRRFQLLIDNGGCIDTLTHSVEVNPLPNLTLSTRSAVVCSGTPLTLTASGAASYSWSPAEGLNTVTGASVQAHPDRPTTYYVTGTSAAGCSSRDSVQLRITLPVSVSLAAVPAPCAGDPITLQASGAARYTWSGPALSAASGASVTARPTSPATYTVIGGDADGCFRDTVTLTVPVRARPTVEAGPDLELNPGTTQTLTPAARADVTSWRWTPAEGLSCTDCPAPVAAPKSATRYKVEVRNAVGCTAADSLEVALLCAGSRIFIPTAFSPNGDGKNDRFTFHTEGIRRAESLRIYNRWGELVWERRDFDPADEGAAWRGLYKGLPVPAGAYVYFLELSCEGQKFMRKGSVMVVY